MGIAPASQELIQATQDTLRGMAVNVHQEVGNVGLASDMAGSAYLAYGRHRYEVPPVQYKYAVELEEIRLKLDEVAVGDSSLEQNRQMGELYDRAVKLFPKLLRPTFGVQRLLWRWVSNPFLTASPVDIATLIYFFCSCRMRSELRLEASSAMRRSRPSTMQLMP
jgi:hypothetical protein